MKQKPSSRRRRNSYKSDLRLPDLEHAKAAVLNGLNSGARAVQMRDASSARQITAGLVQAINTTDIRLAGISMTLARLADHFHQRELGRSNGRISYSTKKAYQGYLNKWIVPRWGCHFLSSPYCT